MQSATNIARCFGISNPQAIAARSGQLASAVRSVNPAGAAVIFAVAYLAGLAGSLAVLLIAAALFAGLYAARVSGSPVPPYMPLDAAPIGAGPTIDVFGLPVAEIKFKAPTAKRAPKVAQPA